MHAGSVNDLIPHAKRGGLLFTCLAASIAATFGWSQGHDLISKVCLAVGLAGASFVVGYALVFAHAAFKQGKHAVGCAAVALFAVAVAVELLSHLGATAASRQADLSQARHQTNTYTDTRGELERARSDLAAMKPTRTPAAISAEMQGIESRPWFAGTANCVSPGSYGNSCRRYIALKGELATAQARAALDKRVQDLTARSAESSTGHSVAGAQSQVLASIATQSTKPTADQEFWTNVGVSMLLAIFFVMSGLLNFIAYAFEQAEPAAQPTAAIVPFKAPTVGTAHVGPTSGPMIPASLKVANG